MPQRAKRAGKATAGSLEPAGFQQWGLGKSDKAAAMQAAIVHVIQQIPRGRVATYGQVAEAAGYPRYHRQVAQVLNRVGRSLPWYRVLGAGGQLKTSLEWALDQRLRLEMEGVGFRGSRVHMAEYQATLVGKPPVRGKRSSTKTKPR
jgi:methylated-DNA-protein-cysteine methyltransferase related protein